MIVSEECQRKQELKKETRIPKHQRVILLRAVRHAALTRSMVDGR
jgi:hypothetical protein